MSTLRKFLFSAAPVSATIALLALLAGCATPATSTGMIPTRYEMVNKHDRTVHVIVTGGRETSAMERTQISNEEFFQALTETIKNSRAFSQVIQGHGVDYELDISIFTIDQPIFGTSFTVTMEVGWTLKRAGNGAVLWQESIISEYTATMSDAFAAVTRLKLATEGAARENISAGLAKISKLAL